MERWNSMVSLFCGSDGEISRLVMHCNSYNTAYVICIMWVCLIGMHNYEYITILMDDQKIVILTN